MCVGATGCPATSRAKGPLGRASGGASTGLLLPPLCFTSPPGPAPNLRDWVSVRLRQPLCSSDFLLLPERHQREQHREGRDESRDGRKQELYAPTYLQILYFTRKLSRRDSAGGGRCPAMLEELLRRLGFRFSYMEIHTNCSAAVKVSWEFSMPPSFPLAGVKPFNFLRLRQQAELHPARL